MIAGLQLGEDSVVQFATQNSPVSSELIEHWRKVRGHMKLKLGPDMEKLLRLWLSG